MPWLPENNLRKGKYDNDNNKNCQEKKVRMLKKLQWKGSGDSTYSKAEREEGCVGNSEKENRYRMPLFNLWKDMTEEHCQKTQE